MVSLSTREGLQQGLAALVGRQVSVRSPGSLEDLRQLCEQTADKSEYPHATSIVCNVPHYDLSSVVDTELDAAAVASLQDEWYRALDSGPGVLVLQNFLGAAEKEAILGQANAAFDRIIESEERRSGGGVKKGDHFAAVGANSRVWNSLQKHAEADPASFVRYYANPWLARVSEAWLGPGYRVTAQLNIVRPGGKPQSPHRDYHLGFQTAEACARFPRGAHLASQYLTLQGGVAHSDVPLDSGPTRLLPFSQRLSEGFAAWRRPEFAAFFHERFVSVSMRAGDAVFFNPALLHAAGGNRTRDVHRSVNLLQISSAMGKPMESVNTPKMIRSCWDELKAFHREGGAGTEEETRACAAVLGEGYPFPTNLDRRPPGPEGMAPESEVDVLWAGLRADWSTEEVVEAIERLKAESSS